MWTTIELSADLFQAVLAIYFMQKTWNLRKHSLLYDIIAIILSAMIISVTSSYELYYLDVMNDIIPILYAVCFTQSRRISCVFWGFASTIIVSAGSTLSSALVTLFGGYSWQTLLEQDNARILYIISANLLIGMMYVVVGNLGKRNYFLSRRTIICFILSVVIQLAASECFFITSITSFENSIMPVYGSICMFGSLILTVVLYEMMIKQAEKQRELELTYQTALLINTHQEEMQTVYSSMLAVQHDLRHRITAAEEMLSRQNSSGSQDVINLLQGQDMLHNYITGSVSADAVLTSKAAIMKKRGIKFFFYPIPLNQLPIDEKQFAVLLSNILDNAIEGTLRRQSDLEDHYVELILSRNWDIFSLTCNNNMDPDTIKYKDKEFLSSKPHPSIHGYGTKSIRNTVEEAGGMIDFVIDGNIFSVKIILPMEDENAEPVI